MADTTRSKTITITFIPSVGVEPKVYTTDGRAGYHVHSDESGGVLGYRLYVDNKTILVPSIQVLLIETEF
jgi:hypothetical protein